MPDEILASLYNESEEGLDFLNRICSEVFPVYTTYLTECLIELGRFHNLSAGFSLANDKSFKYSCESVGLKVIYSEGGPVRRPAFDFGTYFFDFCGVNGAHGFKDIYDLSKNFLKDEDFLSVEFLRAALYKNINFIDVNSSAYELGVALQVEDDSNLIVYSNGYTSLKLLFKALWVFPRGLICIRQHPLSRFHLNTHDFGDIDNSDLASSFILKCKRLITINSSVAFESILLGRETYVLGESPLNLYAQNYLDRELKYKINDSLELTRFLNIFLFAYLIPEWLWLDKEYFDFRLSAPSLADVFNFHKASYIERGFFR